MSQVLTTDKPLVARAGNHTVQLTQPSAGVYRVEVLRTGAVARPVEDLTRSYSSESLARTIARVLTVALRTPGATVKTARRAVVRHIDAELALLLMQPGVAGRVEKADILLDLRAGFAAGDLRGGDRMKVIITFRDTNTITVGPVYGDDDLDAAEMLRARWLADRSGQVALVCSNTTVDVDLGEVVDIAIEVA